MFSGCFPNFVRGFSSKRAESTYKRLGPIWTPYENASSRLTLQHGDFCFQTWRNDNTKQLSSRVLHGSQWGRKGVRSLGSSNFDLGIRLVSTRAQKNGILLIS